MKASNTVFSPRTNCFFLREEQLIAGISQLERSKGVSIRIDQIEGDTVYAEVKKRMDDIGLSRFELLELAYSLLVRHLPQQYRLAIEL